MRLSVRHALRPGIAPFLILLAAVVLQCAAPRAAAEELVIFGNDYKIPKIYKDEQGRPGGILIDIARHLDERMPGYFFQYRLYPWARAYKAAEAGLGGIIGISMTSERLKVFDYSDPVYVDEVVVVVRRGNEFPFSGLEDLAGLTVGVGQGGSFGDAFDRAIDQGVFRVSRDNGPVSRLKMLLAGRIDCALISPGRLGLERAVAQDETLWRNREAFRVLDQPLLRDPNYLAFAKSLGMRPFLDAFNAALRQARESGEFERIVERYASQAF